MIHKRGESTARIEQKRGKLLSVFILYSLVVGLTGCKSSQPPATSLPFFPTYTITPQLTQTVTYTSTPTSNTPATTEAWNSPGPSPTRLATVTADATLFMMPTQGEVPVTDWRPPLYPDPWAPTLNDHFFFTSPIAANEINAPVSDYRYGGTFFEDVVHTGVDIPAPKGTPIHAAGPGTVMWAGYGVFQGGFDPADPYGLAVTILHDFGYQNQQLYTVYGHMDEIDVAVGQHIETGDLLGKVGETGRVTGPHLHFEVRIGKNDFFTTRNPELWLVPPIGWGIIAGRMTDSVGQPIYDQQIIITDPQQELNWFAWSYGKTAVNSDPYYRENLVIGNMPAGTYVIRVAWGGVYFNTPIEVHPGVVNYFTFTGYYGLSVGPPQEPGASFTPAPVENPIP